MVCNENIGFSFGFAMIFDENRDGTTTLTIYRRIKIATSTFKIGMGTAALSIWGRHVWPPPPLSGYLHLERHRERHRHHHHRYVATKYIFKDITKLVVYKKMEGHNLR